jgi:hypothetical protein
MAQSAGTGAPARKGSAQVSGSQGEDKCVLQHTIECVNINVIFDKFMVPITLHVCIPVSATLSILMLTTQCVLPLCFHTAAAHMNCCSVSYAWSTDVSLDADDNSNNKPCKESYT